MIVALCLTSISSKVSLVFNKILTSGKKEITFKKFRSVCSCWHYASQDKFVLHEIIFVVLTVTGLHCVTFSAAIYS